jgi:hypothetical protein
MVLKSDWGVGIIYRSTSTNTLRAATLSAYGTYLGSWYLRSTDTIYGAGDFDGTDSDDEFVIQGTSGLAIIERTTNGMNALRHVTAGTSIGSYQYNANDIVQGIGDVNGDGRAEIILKGPSGLVVLGYGSSGFSLYNRVAVDGYAGSWRLLSSDDVRAIGDFNDDGSDDLLLQRGGTVLGVLYRTSSGALVELVRDTFSQTPTVRAIGDFQGTGRDLILVDYPNGGMEMLSVGSTSIASIERNAYQNQVENTDGFWGTTAYFMLGSWPLQTTDYFPYTAATRMDRRFRGVGDFDEDGREDFVIQN